ncbi:MAG: hypothetical protein AABZ06_12930 [Bdellovibrionota bacterium]
MRPHSYLRHAFDRLALALLTASSILGLPYVHLVYAETPGQSKSLVGLNTPDDYESLRKAYQQEGLEHAPLNPLIDGQRLIHPDQWLEALRLRPGDPWNTYSDITYSNWEKGLKWVNSNADGTPLGLYLYDKLEKIVMKDHYYAGFEIRRIEEAFNNNKIDLKSRDQLLERIKHGERIYFSGVDHSTLPARFRWEILDEFVHNGDHVSDDGARYMTQSELSATRGNPLLTVHESSIKKIEGDRYIGEVLYPRIDSLKKNTLDAFDKAQRGLARARSVRDIVSVVIEMEIELLTIHRSLDGNGRVIRLLCDLMYRRNGLPPPIRHVRADIFSTKELVLEETLVNMRDYNTTMSEVFRSYHPEIPQYLYHWTSKESIKWMVRNNPNPRQVPMQTIPSQCKLTKLHPGLIDHRGTFAWSDPVSAISGGDNGQTPELYGKTGKHGEPPILLAMRPKREQRVLVIRTQKDAMITSYDAGYYDQFDMIYHEKLNPDGSVVYREWVVLRPESISSFSADPRVTAPLVKPYLNRLRNGPRFLPEELHFADIQPDRTVSSVEAYFNGGRDHVPKVLLRPIADVSNGSDVKTHQTCVTQALRRLIEYSKIILSF